MDNKTSQNKWNFPIIYFCIFLVVIVVLFLQFCYLSLSKKVYGIDMQAFASTRNTVTSTLTAQRGNIFDIQGNTLAQNITSYTLIAYLDENRTIDSSAPKHVVDKDYTATKLSKVLGEDNYEYILERLNKNSKQVEFGTIGKNLTELTKLAIEEMNLPGISFTETIKRYYPNGDFASYIIGYAKQYTKINIKVNESYDIYNYYKSYFLNYDDITLQISDEEVLSIRETKLTGLKKGNSLLFLKSKNQLLTTIYVNVTDYDNVNAVDTTIIGELGIESNFEAELQGIDGYIKYQQDKYGYQIPNTHEEKVESINGYDIYLTIDSNIQRFAESAVDELEKYEPEWSMVSVMEAKTGAILASATTPSYNPNSLSSNMSYQNPLVSYGYEPGSVMKIYTYMCAMETGKYNGNKEYLSGSHSFEDGTKINDWDKKGWGILTYDNGFAYSSNVAIINIIKDYLSMSELKKCLESYGFGKVTGIELSNEESGNLKNLNKSERDLMSGGYGQGISTTAIQQLQALSIIANDGVMVSPYIIDSIVNNKTNEIEKTKINKSEKLVSSNTISKIKDLMHSVIKEDSPTGSKYYIEGYDLIGKTGTAQISENGKYLTGSNDYVVSIALMYPKKNPEIIIYAAMKKPNSSYNTALTKPIKELVKNISKYKSIYSNNAVEDIKLFKLDTYISEDTKKTIKELEEQGLSVIVIGNGDKVIKQYPNKNTEVLNGDKVFLITNSTEYKMHNLNNWSRFDISKYCNFTGIICNFEGSGYAVDQNISEGTIINSESVLDIKLDNKIKNRNR